MSYNVTRGGIFVNQEADWEEKEEEVVKEAGGEEEMEEGGGEGGTGERGNS
jgi:hypothetical protein